MVDVINRLTKYSESVLVSYTISHLAKSDKVRFFYALMGRGDEVGVLQRSGTQRLGRCVLLVSREQSKEIEDFLKYWKCEYMQRLVYVERQERGGGS